MFNQPSFHPNKQYLCVYVIAHLNEERSLIVSAGSFFAGIDILLPGIQIVAAVVITTRGEDLADAFNWFANRQSSSSQDTNEFIRDRYLPCMTAEYIPQLTRAINNEVACMMINDLSLEFRIRTTGIRAAVLNNKEGVIRGLDPANNACWIVLLNNGTNIRKIRLDAANFVHVHLGVYKHRAS
jgi:hypothetical protein